MKKIMIRLLPVFVFIILVGCGGPVHSVTPDLPPTPSVTGGIVEIGHMVYIPLNLDGDLEANIESVMMAVKVWEEENPSRQVVDFDIVYDQAAYATSPMTYGVTIYFTEK